MPDDRTPPGPIGQRMADDIRELILSGELEPGSRIRQENLAERFGVSRIPVRHALQLLEHEGLITVTPSSGAWVARLDLGECLELYKIREVVEPLALRESTPNLIEDDIETLRRMAKQISLAASNEAFLKLDREFHLYSYRAANSPRLQAMVTGFWNTTQQYRRIFVGLVRPAQNWVIDYEHALLVEAIARRDAEDAGRILHGHIRRTRLELEQHADLFPAARPKKRRRSKAPNADT